MNTDFSECWRVNRRNVKIGRENDWLCVPSYLCSIESGCWTLLRYERCRDNRESNTHFFACKCTEIKILFKAGLEKSRLVSLVSVVSSVSVVSAVLMVSV